MGLTASFKKRQHLKDFVNWFEIPVYDIHRAARFYGAIYNIDMQPDVSGKFAMALFPADKGIGGALVAGPGCTPNATGVLIYLNAGTELDRILERVPAAGGRVIMSRTTISESAGAFALFIDSEGNRLALHENSTRPSPPPTIEAAPAARATPAKPRAARARKVATKPSKKSVSTSKTAKPRARRKGTKAKKA